MKILYVSVLLAGLLVGCGSDSDDSSTGAEVETETAVETGTAGGSTGSSTESSVGGSSQYLKFDEAFMSERETVDERYFIVQCEDVGLSYNGRDYGDVASYDANGIDYVSQSATGGASYTLADGKLTFQLSNDVTLNLVIDKDYGDYAVVKIIMNNYPASYTYWYPRPINSDVEGAFFGQGGTYMDHESYKFNHQGSCSPNSLNEHIADWKSKQ